MRLGTVGKAIPGTELRIVRDDGGGSPERRVGRVHARGPSLMNGYLGMARETARVLRDGWLDTGDLGFLDDGELYLTGRAKDVVILRGRNYDPAWFEDAAARTPGIRSGRIVIDRSVLESLAERPADCRGQNCGRGCDLGTLVSPRRLRGKSIR